MIMMTREQIIDALNHAWPNAEWAWDGDDYDDLVWLGTGSKPALHDVQAVEVPERLPLPRIISRRQFYQGLAVAEFITKTEALDAIRTGTLPAAIQAIVDGMTDEDAAFTAEMLLAGATEFDVEHPLVLVFAVAQGMGPSEVDDFWRLCASLT